MLDSALEDDPEDLHPDAREFVAQIRKFGWMATHIYASETAASFTYTTGLCATKGLPEFIVFALGMEVAHGSLHLLVEKMERGLDLTSGKAISGLLEGVDVLAFPTAPEKHAQFLLRSGWFYDTDEFPCWQLVIPDTLGRFPWEPGVHPGFKDLQPDLTELGWIASIANEPTANDA